MNIANAEQIKGWMEREELTWLAIQSLDRQKIVEVGSFIGRSTRALADNTSGIVYAVDTWDGSAEHQELLADVGPDCLFDAFLESMGEHIATEKVRPIRGSSINAAGRFAELGEKFDMIFIDGSHDYESVKADILAWKPLLADNGLLCGHDFFRYAGLNKAVRELLPDFQVMHNGTIWFSGSSVLTGRKEIRSVRKTLYTLNVGMKYAPEICELTYPFLRLFANKCGADFHIIMERRYPEMPITFEKLQIYELGRHNDWNIYFDSDALVHPDTYDPTEHLPKDTVLHNGKDMAGNRFRYDNYFRRDGRNIGSGNWFTVASDWCIDLWKPPDDLTLKQMVDAISPTRGERAAGVTADHLIDDYILSRNIAKYGLKYKTYMELTKDLSRNEDEYFWHHYTVPIAEKVKLIKEVLERWKLKIENEQPHCA